MSIDWSKANPANVALVIAEYEKMLSASRELYTALDGKARWVLTVTIPLGTLVAGYVFADGATNVCSGIGAGALAILFFIASALATWALKTRVYLVGAVVPRSSLDGWKTLFSGGENEANEFAGMRLETLANAVAINDQSNDAKSAHIRRAIWAGTLAVPIAGTLFVVCHVFLLFAVPTVACPAII